MIGTPDLVVRVEKDGKSPLSRGNTALGWHAQMPTVMSEIESQFSIENHFAMHCFAVQMKCLTSPTRF